MTLAPHLSATELQQAMAAGAVSLIDVRLADDHAAEHLPGAVGNCVFEVSFVPRAEEAFGDRATPLCVYGASADSRESEMAADKLRRAGYENVSELVGGIAAWEAAGFETVTGPPVGGAPADPDGRYAIDLDESTVVWLGRNLLSKHWGTIALKGGELRFAAGELAGGELTLDMTAMRCADLAGGDLHDVLIAHLQSDDFFDTELHPEARLLIESSRRIAGRAAGQPNLRIDGQLTLRGETRPLSFDAVAGIAEDGRPAAQATFAIDRTEWGVIYGSGKFFKRLAGHLVNDLIELQVRVLAGPSG